MGFLMGSPTTALYTSPPKVPPQLALTINVLTEQITANSIVAAALKSQDYCVQWQ